MIVLLNYFISKKDCYGYVHSVDNLVITYSVNPIFQSSYLDMFVDSLHNLKDKYSCSINYWERLNVNACSKYSWYCNHIHLDDGIYISLGHYREGIKEKATYVIFPLLKLEVNPNKHWGKPILQDLLSIINKFCTDAILNKYDYAIDIPCKIDDIQIFNTRKEKGLYKRTRYFGQRNKDGFCRIYDKSKESSLETDLTRVEHTFSLVKHTKSKSFTNFSVLQKNCNSVDVEGLTSNDLVILNLCNRLKESGLDYLDLLDNLNFRKRKKIVECLTGSYLEVVFNQEVHDELLKQVMDHFNIKEVVESKDSDFVEIDDNFLLPWNE